MRGLKGCTGLAPGQEEQAERVKERLEKEKEEKKKAGWRGEPRLPKLPPGIAQQKPNERN